MPLPCHAIVFGTGAGVFANTRGAGGGEVAPGVTVRNVSLWAMNPIIYDNVGGPDNRT